MNGWKTVGVVCEGDPMWMGGLNVWHHKWKRLEWPRLELPHPSYPAQRHSMSIYAIAAGGKCVRFAAGELSANVYGFYVPEV